MDISEIIDFEPRDYKWNEILKIDNYDGPFLSDNYNKNFKKSLDEDKKNRTEGFAEGLKKLFSNY